MRRFFKFLHRNFHFLVFASAISLLSGILLVLTNFTLENATLTAAYAGVYSLATFGLFTLYKVKDCRDNHKARMCLLVSFGVILLCWVLLEVLSMVSMIKKG